MFSGSISNEGEGPASINHNILLRAVDETSKSREGLGNNLKTRSVVFTTATKVGETPGGGGDK